MNTVYNIFLLEIGFSLPLRSIPNGLLSCTYRQYFRKACDVADPEVHFNIDQYMDATLAVKPQIYISVKDLLSTHSKLLEHEAKIAPESTDVIHELLQDLGEKAPTIEELLGGTCDHYM